MFIVFLSAIVSSATHISLGNVSWIYALILIPGAWIGGKIGAYINTKLSGNAVINLLRITLIILGTRLIITFYNAFFLECVFIHMNIKILLREQIKLDKHIITCNWKYVLSSR